jgi:thiamine pyrophosphate-dependent acetolactate synthase large subunit-like protein
MGVGLPYGMGAQLAHPDATVACVTGEGSIQMCIQELSTCKQYRLPLKIINLNNRYAGHGPSVAGNVLRKSLFGVPTWIRCRISSSWPKPMATSA